MIEFINIQKTFSAGTVHEVKAVKDLNLVIQEKEFVVMVGTNGSGKSTLFNLLAGSVKPDQGQILINKRDVTNLKEHQRCKYISRIFQNPLSGTAPELSILDNFRLSALRTQSKKLVIGTTVSFRNLIRERISSLHWDLKIKSINRWVHYPEDKDKPSLC